MISWCRTFLKGFPEIVFLLLIIGCSSVPQSQDLKVSEGPPEAAPPPGEAEPLEDADSDTPRPPEEPQVKPLADPPKTKVPDSSLITFLHEPPRVELPKGPPIFLAPEFPEEESASALTGAEPPLEIPSVYERIAGVEIPQPQAVFLPVEYLPPAPLPPPSAEPPKTESPPLVLPEKGPPVRSTSPKVLKDEASPKAPSSTHSWKIIESQEDGEFFVSPRESRLVVLEGLGWTLQGGSVDYRLAERYAEEGNTHFTFLFSQAGRGDLLFQRQDISRQVLHKKRLFLDLKEASPQNPEGGEGLGGDGEPESAAAEKPNWAFFFEALGSGNLEAFRGDRWRDFLLAGEGRTEGLLEMGKALWQRGEWEILKPLVESLQRRDPPPRGKDSLLLLLGRFHDRNSPWRNESLALKYYRELTENFPSSLYWEEADKRARYLRRYYFQIR